MSEATTENETADQPNPIPRLRLAVLVSGSGRTLNNLLEWISSGRLQAQIGVVVASRANVRGVTIATGAGIPVRILPPAGAPRIEWSKQVFAACRPSQPDLVVMAGFLHLLDIPDDFCNRVINIHPSLLPAFGGQGFYGLHVHRAVLQRGCTVSGCTVHIVDSEYDHGPILLQRSVNVLPNDTPESLAARVFAAECNALPEALNLHAAGLLPQLERNSHR